MNAFLPYISSRQALSWHSTRLKKFCQWHLRVAFAGPVFVGARQPTSGRSGAIHEPPPLTDTLSLHSRAPHRRFVSSMLSISEELAARPPNRLLDLHNGMSEQIALRRRPAHSLASTSHAATPREDDGYPSSPRLELGAACTKTQMASADKPHSARLKSASLCSCSFRSDLQSLRGKIAFVKSPSWDFRSWVRP